MSIPREDIVRVVMTWSRGEVDRDPMVNVIHVVSNTEGGDEAAADLAESLATGSDITGTGVLEHMSDRIHLSSITVYSVPATGPAVVLVTRDYADESPWVGNVTASMLPPQACAVVSLRTPQPGRSGRGRFFVGGLTVVSVTSPDGRINSTVRSDLAGTFSQLNEDGWGEHPNTRLVVWSPTLGVANDLSHVVVDNAYDVQRSRGQEPTTATVESMAGITE